MTVNNKNYYWKLLHYGFTYIKRYFSLFSYTNIRWLWVWVTIYYARLLLTIYCSCRCNKSLRYFYWKFCFTCYFLENVSLANLSWIEPYYLALPLFLIKIAFGEGFSLSAKSFFNPFFFFFQKHQFKVVLLFWMFFYCTLIPITFWFEQILICG